MIHISSETYEASDYSHNLDLLIISHKLRVSLFHMAQEVGRERERKVSE